MSKLPLNQSPDEAFYYYSFTIGGIIIFIIITITLIHILRHYITTFHGSNRHETSQQTKITYQVYFIITVALLYVCIDYSILRATIFTSESTNNFTQNRCTILSVFSVIAIIIAKIGIYVLFLLRIQISFHGTTFAHSKKVYVALFMSLIITMVISLTLTIGTVTIDVEYALYYFNPNKPNQVWCDVKGEAEYSSQDTNNLRRTFSFLGGTFAALYTIVYSIILLYMFTKKLYLLQKTTIEQHMSEMSRMGSYAASKSSGDTTPNPGSPSTPDPSTNPEMAQNHTNDESVTGRGRAMSIEEVESRTKENCESSRRIMTLHTLIKKVTILVWIAIVANLIWIFLAIFVSSWWMLMIEYVEGIENICAWLMFAANEKYWLFMKKYCCCVLCYFNKKKDIDSKNCLCFC